MVRPIIWHRQDLRVHDNAAVEAAGPEAIPVYVIEPDWLDHELVSDARVRFVLECLADLDRQYRERGTRLQVLIGDPLSILDQLKEQGHSIVTQADANTLHRGRIEEIRDRFTTVAGEAVDPDGRDRDWWQGMQAWFRSEQHDPPSRFEDAVPIDGLSVSTAMDRYGRDPDQDRFGRGGTAAGLDRLRTFLEEIERYAGSLSSPADAEDRTSKLSPYIRYGAVSVRRAHQRTRDIVDGTEPGRAVRMFLDRLEWQQHFAQKIEDNPQLMDEAINPVFRDLHRDGMDEELIHAWKTGQTGYPLVDASMRALRQTGWISFRMRAMCASFFSYGLKQWWKIGADHFYRYLIDADVAINYYQWQMQSGLVGVHANRIYDPVKQVEDNDPDGRFIRRYVDELEALPDAYLARPWEMSDRIQQECGVQIGETYPGPIVDHETEARRSRRFFSSKAAAARSAFEQDTVWERASLGPRHDREQILDRDDERQGSLMRFMEGDP